MHTYQPIISFQIDHFNLLALFGSLCLGESGEAMATSSSSGSNKKDGFSADGVYECHICFEQAKDAVVSMCGHLFW